MSRNAPSPSQDSTTDVPRDPHRIEPADRKYDPRPLTDRAGPWDENDG